MTTITRTEFREIMEAVSLGEISGQGAFNMLADRLALPAESEPPAAMVKLAREIVSDKRRRQPVMTVEEGALAALQHAAKVVRDAPYITTPPGPVVNLYHILRQLGAE